MRQAGTLSILLAAALMLLPWQICACDEDGPHLTVLWDHEGCAREAPAGTPEDAGDEAPDDDCGSPFTFEASVSTPGPDLPLPDEVHPGHAAAVPGAALELPRTPEGRPRIPPSEAVGPGSQASPLATRLLL